MTELGPKSATNAKTSSFSGHAVNNPALQGYVMWTKQTVTSAQRKIVGGFIG
jgi:hypothetical protein